MIWILLLPLCASCFPPLLQDDTIIREGDRGDNFYILARGECTAFVKSAPDLQLNYKAGDSFGELALIHGSPDVFCVVLFCSRAFCFAAQARRARRRWWL